MQIYYFLPIILIIAGVAYSLYVRKAALASAANMSPEQAAQKFQEFYSQYFEIPPGEQLVGVWSGVEFHAPKTMGQQAGAVAGELAMNVVGFSSYVPNVHLGLTASGKVLVSREYSDMGSRGNFKQILALGSGTRALNAQTAHPGENIGKAPSNPFNPMVSLEFAQIRAPGGEAYEAWLSPQGVLLGQAGFHPIWGSLN